MFWKKEELKIEKTEHENFYMKIAATYKNFNSF